MASSNTQSKVRHSSNLLSFEPLHLSCDTTEGRIGRLCFQGRPQIETPHYVAVSSRGAVPHLSQDMMRENTSIKGIYTALEDCKCRVIRYRLLENRRPMLTYVLSLEPASHRESLTSITDTACL